MTHRVAVAVPRAGPTVPPRRRARSVVVAAVLVAAATVGLVGWLLGARTIDPAAATPRLVVWDHEAGAAAYHREVVPGETFTLEHTHSVTRRLVVETFSVHGPDTIAIEQMWFDAFGPNLPTGPEPVGERVTTFVDEDDGYRVVHGGHPIGTVPIRVGSATVDHVLTFEDGEQVRLLDVARAGSHVELIVRSGESGDRERG